MWLHCVEAVHQNAIGFAVTPGVLEHPFVAFVLPILKRIEDFGTGDWGAAGELDWVFQLVEIAGDLGVEGGEMEHGGEEE